MAEAPKRVTRVIIERPAPAPVRRVCIRCGAVFDDYSGQEAIFCSKNCNVRMSELKRAQAPAALHRATGWPMEQCRDLCSAHKMAWIIKTLGDHGLRWQHSAKDWIAE